MTLTDRSRALVDQIDEVSKQPLLVRAQRAESLVREAAELLVELSIRVDHHEAALIDLCEAINRVHQCAKLSAL